MNKAKLFLIAALMTISLLGSAYSAAPPEKPSEVKLSGTLICVGCELKSRCGANAQCSVYGHDHALKTAAGKIYTFLPNDKSADLIKGENHHGDRLTVTATVPQGTQILDVKTVKWLGGK